MLQQPESFEGQQKSPDVSAVGEGEGAAVQTAEGSSWQAAEALRRSCLVPAGTKERDKRQAVCPKTWRMAQGGKTATPCWYQTPKEEQSMMSKSCTEMCNSYPETGQDQASQEFLQQFFPISTVILQSRCSTCNLLTKGILSKAMGCVHKAKFSI